MREDPELTAIIKIAAQIAKNRVVALQRDGGCNGPNVLADTFRSECQKRGVWIDGPRQGWIKKREKESK